MKNIEIDLKALPSRSGGHHGVVPGCLSKIWRGHEVKICGDHHWHEVKWAVGE